MGEREAVPWPPRRRPNKALLLTPEVLLLRVRSNELGAPQKDGRGPEGGDSKGVTARKAGATHLLRRARARLPLEDVQLGGLYDRGGRVSGGKQRSSVRVGCAKGVKGCC